MVRETKANNATEIIHEHRYGILEFNVPLDTV